MTPVEENVDLTPRGTVATEELPATPQSSAEPAESRLFQDPTTAPESNADQHSSQAREFLNRIGLIDKMSAIGELNREIRTEHPQLDNLYKTIEDSPQLLNCFLKIANSSWFNSRIKIESPVMAFSRFGTEGFYRLMIATLLQDSIGELSTKFRIWPHLEWTARAGEMVAQQLAPKLLDETFAAGLLHDAVVAPMERELQDYLYFLECALQTDGVVTGLENSCHNFDHAQAAAELARALNFEACIVDAIGGHHQETLSSIPAGDSRAVLALLHCTKRALCISRGQKKAAFESAAEKGLLREIAAALNVSSGRIVNAITDVVDMLHVPTA